MGRISRLCPAKINLFLDVLKKRRDGFHTIRSLFAEITLADKISLKLTENSQIKISCTSEEINNRSNLVYKIASYLKNKYKVKQGIEIHLEKNIPLAAGLGGGSSDAAQTIKICNQLWNLHLSRADMHKIAAKFGSDINFFLLGGVKLVQGRGEKISPQPCNLKLAYILLVNPRISISSTEAYAAVTPARSHENAFLNMQKALNNHDTSLLCQNLYNALEKEIMTKYEKINFIKQKLTRMGAQGSLMSGSGSTVFAIFNNRRKLKQADDYFRKNNYWTHHTSLGLN